jgi:hypothetical protein
VLLLLVHALVQQRKAAIAGPSDREERVLLVIWSVLRHALIQQRKAATAGASDSRGARTSASGFRTRGVRRGDAF